MGVESRGCVRSSGACDAPTRTGKRRVGVGAIELLLAMVHVVGLDEGAAREERKLVLTIVVQQSLSRFLEWNGGDVGVGSGRVEKMGNEAHRRAGGQARPRTMAPPRR